MAENETTQKLVGHQLFSYAELEKAWDELKANVENDPENKENPPVHGYDIRNGYDTTSGYNPCENHWDMDFSLDAITQELESVGELITAGDLEVYWCGDDYADSDEHGIIIRDGKIKQVY